MSAQIEVVEDPARSASAIMVGAAADGGHVVLAGGSTPKAAYEQFVSAVTAVGVQLLETTFWFGDERCVAPEDERSNYLMVKQSLLDRLPEGNRPQVHRMRGELGAAEGAERYEQALGQLGPERFDLVLLGIGPDGHTASLFPDGEAVQERSRAVVGVEQAGLEPYVPRITMTLAALARAEKIVVLAAGEPKADAVAAAFGPRARPDPHVPSSLVPSVADQVIVLLDPPAAGGL